MSIIVSATTSGMRKWRLSKYKILNFSKDIVDDYAHDYHIFRDYFLYAQMRTSEIQNLEFLKTYSR